MPTWGASIRRAGLSASILLAVFILVLDQPLGAAIAFALLALLLYTPLFHMSDLLIHRRRQRKKQQDEAH